MPVFTVTGDVDPFLHASLAKGETIYCESDAMVMMEATLDLKGKMKGGLGSALMRTFANGESFFQQHIEAVRGNGDCLLSPTLPGAMQVVDVGPNHYIISDGAFVAASSGVNLKARTQSIGNALCQERRLLRHRDRGQRAGGGVRLRLDVGARGRAGQGRHHRQRARGVLGQHAAL